MLASLEQRWAALGQGRAGVWGRRLSPDAWALVAITAIVLLANLPYLLDFFDPNPLGPRSDLFSSVVPGRVGGSSTIDPNNGYASQALGHLAALDVLKLHLPWWNPYEGTGMPLLGGTQSAALFPPTLLTALANGQLYEHILFELVAGITTYLLLRRILVTRWVALGASIVFALNGTFAWFQHATVNPIALLPMLLLGIELVFAATRDDRPGGWWLLALAGGLSVYAGFPEVAYIDTLMGLCWFGWRCSCLERRQLRPFLLKAAAGSIAGALIAAPMLVGMADYYNHADLGAHSNSMLGSDRLGTTAMPQLLLPYIYGPIFGFSDAAGTVNGLWGVLGGYLDTTLVLFSLLGLVGRRARLLRLVVLAWGLLVFARMYGQPPLLDKVIGVLPGMSKVAFFRYGNAALELSFVILAALGLDDLNRQPQVRGLRWAALLVLALVVLTAVEARPMARALGPHFAHRPYYVAAVTWGALVIVASAAATFIRFPPLRSALLATLLALDAFALFVAPELSAPRAVNLDLAPAAYLGRHLGDSRFFTLGPLQPNYGSYFALSELNLNDLPPSAFSRYVHDRLDPIVQAGVFVGNSGGGRPPFAPTPEQELLRNLAGYRDAAVSYVLTPAHQALPQSASTFSLVYRSPSTWIYHLAGAAGYFSASDRNCRVSASSRETVEVSCPKAAVLVRRETYFRGWAAELDGRGVPIHRNDGLFQAVAISTGRHTVRFAFSPPNMGWAGLASVAGLVTLIAPVAFRRRRRGAGPAHGHDPGGTPVHPAAAP